MKPLTDLPPSNLQQPRPERLRGYRFLAEGDSWFTLSALNPLQELQPAVRDASSSSSPAPSTAPTPATR